MNYLTKNSPKNKMGNQKPYNEGQKYKKGQSVKQWSTYTTNKTKDYTFYSFLLNMSKIIVLC